MKDWTEKEVADARKLWSRLEDELSKLIAQSDNEELFTVFIKWLDVRNELNEYSISVLEGITQAVKDSPVFDFKKKIIEIIGHGMEPERAECKADEIVQLYNPMIVDDAIRYKFFKECTEETGGIRKVNMAAHDLFEWFRKNSPAYISNREKNMLEDYTRWLLKNAYVDTDVYCEPPTTVDQFIEFKTKQKSQIQIK